MCVMHSCDKTEIKMVKKAALLQKCHIDYFDDYKRMNKPSVTKEPHCNCFTKYKAMLYNRLGFF